MLELNDEQRAAVEATERRVLVSAGAGSGKTRVLVARYLRLLEELRDSGEKYPAERILALTFTNKAANEMRERLVGMFSSAEDRAIRQSLLRAPIGTIHSFCERILHEHALDAGINPEFVLLDDAEMRTIQEDVLTAVIAEAWESSARGGAANAHLRALLLEVPRESLRTSLIGILRTLRSRGIEVASLTLPPMPVNGVALAREAFTAVTDLAAVAEGSATWAEVRLNIHHVLAEVQTATAGKEESPDIFPAVEKLLSAVNTRSNPRNGKELVAAAKIGVAAWRGALLETIATPYVEAFLALLMQCDSRYQSEKDARDLLDFDDLLWQTRALLGSKTRGAALLRGQYRHVLVDEFQDTNALQLSIITALTGDGNLFTVGDAKQAIYGFLGSDVREFLREEARVRALVESGVGSRLPIYTNYRSRPELLAVVNAIFESIWEDNAEGDVRHEPLKSEKSIDRAACPCMEVAFWPGDESASAQRDREASWLARRIRELAEQGEETHYGDVLVLVRATTDLARYADALGKADIPYYVVSGRGFYEAPEIRDVLSLIRVLENPLDDLALAALLRSPFVGLSDNGIYLLAQAGKSETPDESKAPTAAYGRLWKGMLVAEKVSSFTEAERQVVLAGRALIHDLQREMATGRALDLIDLAFARTGYPEAMLAGEGGEQAYANLGKLREQAAAFQDRGLFDLMSFGRYLQQIAEMQPREVAAPIEVEHGNVVRLMTIHAAKGLESPIVFLVDCGRKPSTRRDANIFLVRNGVVTAKALLPGGEAEATPSYTAAVKDMQEDNAGEQRRLLYVALTRAEKHLVVSGNWKATRSEGTLSEAQILCHALGIEALPGEDTTLCIGEGDQQALVQVWGEETLNRGKVEEATAVAPTLWESERETILAEQPIARVVPEAELRSAQRLIARVQPLPPAQQRTVLRAGVSRILCYDQCPRQYWFRYLLHSEGAASRSVLPPLVEVEQREEADRARTDGTELGHLVHRALQHADFSASLPAQTEGLLALVAEETGRPTPADGPREVETRLRRLEAMSIYPRLRAATATREVSVLAQEGGVLVPGIIDVLAQDADGWWILDYKTGRRHASHVRQVGLYALAVQHALGIKPGEVVLAYLDEDGADAVRREPVTERLLDDARLLIRRVGETLPEDTTYHPEAGPWCRECPYREGCPEGTAFEQR